MHMVIQPPSTGLLRDDFDGAALDPRWIVDAGTWTVSGGRARASATDNARFKTQVDGIPADVAVECVIDTVSDAEYTGAGPGIWLSPTDYVALYVRKNAAFLRADNGDAWSIAHNLDLVAPVRARIIKVGGIYHVLLNGVEVGAPLFASKNLPVWGVGVYQNLGSTSVVIDSIEVIEDLDVPPIEVPGGDVFTAPETLTSTGDWQTLSLASLPDGDPVPTVTLPAGQWVMLVFSQVGGSGAEWASDRDFRVSTASGVWAQTLHDMDGEQNYASAVQFTLASARPVQVQVKHKFSGRAAFRPGDVVAFAPIALT